MPHLHNFIVSFIIYGFSFHLQLPPDRTLWTKCTLYTVQPNVLTVFARFTHFHIAT